VGKFLALDRIADSENWWLHIEIPAEVEKYAVYKGSICIGRNQPYPSQTERETLQHRYYSTQVEMTT